LGQSGTFWDILNRKNKTKIALRQLPDHKMEGLTNLFEFSFIYGSIDQAFRKRVVEVAITLIDVDGFVHEFVIAELISEYGERS